MKAMMVLISAWIIYCTTAIAAYSIERRGSEELGLREVPRLGEFERAETLEREPAVDFKYIAEKQTALKEIAACEGGSGCKLSVEKLVENLIKYDDGVIREDLQRNNEMLDMPPAQEEKLLEASIPDADDFRAMVDDEREFAREELPGREAPVLSGKQQFRGEVPQMAREEISRQERPMLSFRPRIPEVCSQFCKIDINGHKYRCRNFLYDTRFPYLFQRRTLTMKCYQCQRLCDTTNYFI